MDIPTKIGAEETLKMTVPYFTGARKFAPSHIIRNDLVSLAREEASRILRDGQRLRHPRPARERASVGLSLDQGIPS